MILNGNFKDVGEISLKTLTLYIVWLPYNKHMSNLMTVNIKAETSRCQEKLCKNFIAIYIFYV